MFDGPQTLEGYIQRKFCEESWFLKKEDMGLLQHGNSDAIQVSEKHQFTLVLVG